MDVSIFSYKNVDIDVTLRNGYVAYTFHHGTDTYGHKIKVGRKLHEVMSATALLLLNAVETIDKLNDQQSV